MSLSLFKFLRRVRIHEGECGAVARALHHGALKGAQFQNEQKLISDEYTPVGQAGLEKASNSTFNERKQMSTKTSLKRIALIAVSALGFGMLSSVGANAATQLLTVPAGSSKNVLNLSSTTTTLTLPGAANDTAVVTFAVTGGVTATYSVAGFVRTGVSAGTSTGTQAGTFTLSRQNSSSADATANLSITVTDDATAGGTIAVFSDATLLYTLTLTASVASNDNPWVVAAAANGPVVPTLGAVTAVTPATLGVSAQSIKVSKTVIGTSDYVAISALENTLALSDVGNYRYVEASGSTFAFSNVSGAVPNGTYVSGATLGTATQIAMPQNGMISTGQVWVHTPATGTVTVTFKERLVDAVTGFITVRTLQTITITVTAPGVLNPVASTAFINAFDGTVYGTTVGNSTSGVAAYPLLATAFSKDQAILAPAALAITGGNASIAGTAKAVIEVKLKDAAGDALIGKLPSVGASISGPGTLSLSVTSGAKNTDGSTGRLLVAPAAVAGSVGSPFAAGSSTFYINVFSDGTSGKSTISIWVDGSVWKTKTMSFYGAPTTLTASQNHKVLAAGGTTGAFCDSVAPINLPANTDNCDGESVATSYVAQVLATDANGIAVPYRSYTAVPDATVVTASTKTTAGDALAESLGATWFSVTTSNLAASGAKGTVSYTTTLADGTTKLASNALTFAIGGAPVSVTMGLASGASTDVGAASSLVFTDKDAAGNAPYDLDVPLSLTSNVALIVGTATNATNSLPTTIAMINGTGTVKFFNPLVPSTVTISGLAAGAIAISTTFSVRSSVADAQSAAAIAAIEAANDASLEAIDAANAATDAANLAAEAADAATVAAEEARDAADAATAAVEALATQVAELIAKLQAQITTLAKTVAKIAKKVKA